MGYKDKKYYKDLHQQAYDKLNAMQAFGESKKEAVLKGIDKKYKIYSFKTYQTYWEHCKGYISYLKEAHPECRNLKQARVYAGEWLQACMDKGMSAWTVQTKAKALGKLFGISPGDPDYFTPPRRRREDIKRSRNERIRDRHFSKTNNDELIKFCKGVGARRAGLTKLRGKDLMTRGQIKADATRLEELSKKKALSPEERSMLRICRDALLFEKSEFFVYLKEKGGRERISPIVGPDVDAIVARFRARDPDEKVWQHVHSCADIHAYRADYSNRIYRMYARPIEDIPYDRVTKGGRRYQSGSYHCRLDEKGRVLDRQALLMASKALGHNRVNVVAGHYLRGL